MSYFLRSRYIDRIKPFIGKDIIKVLTGQRRVGKSYMLLQLKDYILQQNPDSNILFINKELNDFEWIKNFQDIIDYVAENEITGKNTVIFIDEVQDIEQFEKALRHFQAKGIYDIYCSGSNAQMFAGELATLLSGRYIEFQIFSLSYQEFLQFHRLENNQESFKKYATIGGLPYLINLLDDRNVYLDYLKTIYQTLIYKDVVARHHIRNTYFLEKLVEYLANNSGNLISSKKISDFLKSEKINISTQIVLNYLKNLEDAFIVSLAERSAISGKKIFAIGQKIYFEDIGIKNAITGFNNIQINQVFENIVYNHLRMNGYSVTTAYIKDKEVDFVGQKDDKLLYIQVAYLIADEKVRKREFENLLAIPDNHQKIVVSGDEFTSSYLGIEHWNIRDFLISFKL